MSIAESAAAAVLAAGLIAISAVLLRRPYRRWRARVGDHGLDLHVELNPAKMEVAGGLDFPISFLFPDKADPRPPPDALLEWWSWAHDLGGEDLYTTVVVVTVQASNDGPIAVDIPEVACTRSEVHGGVIRCPEGVGGGGIQARRYVVELAESGRLTPVYQDPTGERPAAFSIGKGDSERFHVVAHATRPGRFEWKLDIPIIHNGHRSTLSANVGGRPFVTVGGDVASTMMWADGGWIETP